MKLRLPRKRIWRAAIYLLSMLLILIAADMLLVQSRRIIHPGFETTRITEPTLADGSIDYLTAIETYFDDGVTPENNAAPLILRALGRKALPANQPPDGITARLGMPHLPEAGDYYVTYEEYCRQHAVEQEDDPTDFGAPAVWPIKVGNPTRQWITANEKPLALLAEASKRSRYFIPFNGGYRTQTLVEILIPHVGLLASTHRALLTRALLRLESGDYQGFHDDVMTVHRLARLCAQAPTMVERIAAKKTLEIPACRVDRLAAASGKLSAQQARDFAQELASLGDLQLIGDTLNFGERLMILDVTQALARMGPTRAGEYLNAAIPMPGPVARIEPPQAFHLIPIPYEESMRTMNHFYDSAMAMMQLHPYSRRIAALHSWEGQVNQAKRHGSILILATSEWAVPIMLPALVRAIEEDESVRMENRVTQVSLALAAFKADHSGAYPATLAELSPTCLPTIPMDSFSEKPLIYARTSAGYTLYSVGPNMADDGGNTTKPGDDITASVP